MMELRKKFLVYPDGCWMEKGTNKPAIDGRIRKGNPG